MADETKSQVPGAVTAASPAAAPPVKPSPAPRPPAAPIPDLAGKTTNAASRGGGGQACRGGAGSRPRRYVSVVHTPRMDRPGVGDLFRGIRGRARGDRA